MVTRTSGARRSISLSLAIAAAFAMAACGSDGDDAASTDPPAVTEATDATASDGDAVDIVNCDVIVPAEDPERILTLNQGATEIALSLGFADQMIGTAYLDDEILANLAADYEAIPVLSAEYPATEVLFDAEPDFVYASYPSAFGAEVAGERGELADVGVGSYLSPAACPDRAGTDEPLTFDLVFSEFEDVANLFGDPAAGEALVVEQQALIDASSADTNADVSVFWWDGGLPAPSAGVCCGAPGMIMNAAGLTNIFGDVEGSWIEVSWEGVIDADPDVIVLIDASWDLAADKQAHLESDPALSELTAVKEQRYVVVPFSASTPGVRNAAVVGELAAAVDEFSLAS